MHYRCKLHHNHIKWSVIKMNEELARFKEALINSGAFKRTATRRDEYRGKICPRVVM